MLNKRLEYNNYFLPSVGSTPLMHLCLTDDDDGDGDDDATGDRPTDRPSRPKSGRKLEPPKPIELSQHSKV